MLCEVSKKTFEDFIDTYPNELVVQNLKYNGKRMIVFADYPKEHKESDNIENYIVAEETIDINKSEQTIYKIKQVGN